jgi:hypothetical protein
MSRKPHEPDHTCPHIDSAIAEMETVRSMNQKLREWGNYWKDQFSEKEQEIADLQKEHQEKIAHLKDKIETLKYELLEEK